MRLLDLFCGAGGSAVGYHRAGFDEIIGIDIAKQPNYPYEFIQADAVEFLADVKNAAFIGSFDFIHASPPCQSECALSKGTNAGSKTYKEYLTKSINLVEAIGKPYCIENVAQSSLRRDLTLCGEYFGLGVLRHRWFQLNWNCPQPEHKKHRGRVAGFRHGEWFEGPYLAVYGRGGGKGSPQQWQKAMDIYWTSRQKEIAQAIPPAYTEYIGSQWLAVTK